MTKSEFYDLWLKRFGDGVCEDDLQKYVFSTGNLIWHLFSWKLLDERRYLAGEPAKAAFDAADKHGAVYIRWFEDEVCHPMTAELCSAHAVDGLYEIYVTAEDFSWTYIKTHEDTCGPYFMSL